MENTKMTLQKHNDMYPDMQSIDFIKLLYQNSFGVGHLVSDPNHSLMRLQQEYDSLIGNQNFTETPLFESIGNGFCRLNLGAEQLNRSDLPLVNKLFLASLNKKKDSQEQFERKLDLLTKLTGEGKLALEQSELKETLRLYHEQKYPMVSHSQTYRDSYAPHYRVIDEKYAKFFSVFSAVERQIEQRQQINMAIEGRCGSGKSTCADLLAELYPCRIIRMDDFFLPFEMKTKQRLTESGENIHYERFQTEVLPSLQNYEPITYRAYQCSSGTFTDKIRLAPSQLTIVEGVYCMHPSLQQAYDYKVFFTMDPSVQKRRILERNGEAMLQKFVNDWIPMEEQYFSAFDIENECDLVIDTS